MTLTRCAGVLLVVVLPIGGALWTSSLQAGIAIVAASGDPSPTGNGTLSLFNGPTLNASGQAAFVAQLAGTAGGTTDHLALYRKDSGGLTQIARTGSTVVNGLTMTGFFSASSWIAADGTVTSIVGAGPTPTQIHNIMGNGGPITLEFPPSSPHPTGNGTLLGAQATTQNDAGVAVYTGIYSGGTPETGIYRRAVDGTFSTVLVRNATAPRGGAFTTVGRGTINEAGQIASNSTVDSNLSSAVRITGSTVVELAREGDLAVDGISTLGGIFSSALAINESGHVAFDAQYTQPSIQRRGVFVADGSELRLLTPGLLPGMTSVVNDARVLGITLEGNVGFWAEATAGIDPASGMYVAGTSGATLVAAEDTLIPSGGKYFRRFFTDAMAYNDVGQLAFLAELSDTANGAATGRGLFAYDPEDGLTEIVKVGDALAGGTVSGLFFYGSLGNVSLQSLDLSLSGLNNAGQVGFGYGLANSAGAGVAIWSPDANFAAGDFNEDGHVDGDDLAAWRQGFGAGATIEHGDGDADGDGDVDGADFMTWQQQLGGTTATAAGAPVPEPASLIVLASTAWVIRPGRRRRYSAEV